MRIEVCGPLNATVRPPGSKSLTQRALLMASLAMGESVIKGGVLCDDTRHLMEALRRLGVKIRESRDAIIVLGTDGRLGRASGEIHLGDNGTGLRFLATALCMTRGDYKLTGSTRLCQRPMGPLLDGLLKLGAHVRSERGDGCAPILIKGNGSLRGGSVSLEASQSSQFASSLLICGPYMKEGLFLELQGQAVSTPYLNMTLEMMRKFGAEISGDLRSGLRVEGRKGYKGRILEIEPDISSGSYFLAASALCGGRVRVEGVGKASLQPDMRICHILERMGSSVTLGDSWIEVEGRLMEGEDLVFDLRDCPDLAPTVAVLGAARRGKTAIINVPHLRFKESDRITQVACELKKVGARVEELSDGMIVEGGSLHGAKIDAHGDHRIAMSFAILGLKVPGMEIRNPECVAKSYPGFWEDLRRISSP